MGAVVRLLDGPQGDIDVVFSAGRLEHVAPELTGIVHVQGIHYAIAGPVQVGQTQA